jgi:hypothetical protein
MKLRRLSMYILGFGLLMFAALVESGSARINIDIDSFEKTVAFIYAADSTGQHANPNVPLGTGFFVEVPRASDPKSAYHMLVTARHIVDPQWANCPGPNPSKIFLRYRPATSPVTKSSEL